MCRRLEKLYRKKENGLLDLDIECEGKSLQVKIDLFEREY